MKKQITVLIQTYKRPEMLRNALQSVALQSKLDLIEEVIVSENGEEYSSKDVANYYGKLLPIKYIKQDKQLTPQHHALKLAEQVNTPYVALLADDDMWSRYHLEEAVRCLNLNTNASSFFGQSIVVSNQSCQATSIFGGSFLLSLSNKMDSVKDFTIWNTEDTAVNCLSGTPLNIFSAVVKSKIHKLAARKSFGDEKYGKLPSSDKLYIWELSTNGNIAISRNISLFYRQHQNSDIQTQLRDNLDDTWKQDLIVSKEIARRASELGYNAVNIWRNNYEVTNQQGVQDYITIFSPLHKDWLLGTEKNNETFHLTNPKIKKLLMFFTPPACIHAYRKLVRLFR